MRRSHVLIACTFLLVGGILAQSPSNSESKQALIFLQGSSSSLDHSGFRDEKLVSFVETEENEVIRDRPYTATAITEMTRASADGNSIRTKTTALLARDSQGRTRWEETTSGHAGWTIITDPLAAATYVLRPAESPDDRLIAARLMNPGGKKQFMLAGLGERQPEKQSGEMTRQVLGTRIIDGIVVEGEKETRTVPAGAVSNESTITLISETWSSPDLGLVMLRKRFDPRVGETIYRLVDIKRVEPDPSLFQIRADLLTKFDQMLTPGSGPK